MLLLNQGDSALGGGAFLEGAAVFMCATLVAYLLIVGNLIKIMNSYGVFSLVSFGFGGCFLGGNIIVLGFSKVGFQRGV